MKKTKRNALLILGGVALALSLVIMPMSSGEGQGSWGMNNYKLRGEGQGSWGMELPTYFNL